MSSSSAKWRTRETIRPDSPQDRPATGYLRGARWHLTSAFACGPPGTRTPNLRIKSPLLCQIELEARRSVATTPVNATRRCLPRPTGGDPPRDGTLMASRGAVAKEAFTMTMEPEPHHDEPAVRDPEGGSGLVGYA